ncbi:unnamed protein product [Durusdinium trenchii]|uniref:Cyclic nucleotide-binding domain-containing protein n=1 Tax=Durusdinium trenchii TaxID=1381693 RepID=A0ABP0SVZ2_9DINO
MRRYLEKIPMMSELERDSFEKVVDSLETFDLMQGDEVNTAGTPALAAWILVWGRLRITKRIVMPQLDSTGQTRRTFDDLDNVDVAPVIVDEHCLDQEDMVVSKCLGQAVARWYTAVAAESSELLRVDKEKFFKCITETRRMSIGVRGTAMYHVKKTTSQTSDERIASTDRRRSCWETKQPLLSEDIWPYLAYFGFAPVACPAVSELGATGGASHTASHAKNLRQPVVAARSRLSGAKVGVEAVAWEMAGGAVADDSHGFLDDMDRRGWYPDPATSFLCGPKRTWSSFTGDLGSAQAMPGYGQQGNIQQGYQDLDSREEEAAEEMEEKSEHLTHMVCGISSGADGGSQVTCGVPMYRDKATGAPYIMPLYTEPMRPKGAAGSSGAPGSVTFSSPQAEAEAARAQMLEASSSARIRSDALNLLRGFLDSAPPATPPSPASGFFFKGPGAPSKVFYPIPSKTSPTGIEVVPDVGPLGEPTPGLVQGNMNNPGVSRHGVSDILMH